MADLPKFINLMIEFGQKLQGHINKKYRPFIKSMLSLQELTKNVNPEKVTLTSQMIAFKLGIQSKSTRCIEMTLGYLHRLFSFGFIDLNSPNYCEDFVLTQATIQRKKQQKYQKQIRNQIMKWLQPLIHFKNNDINNLVLKNYQYLIGQQILHSLLEMSEQIPNQQCYSLICSYFNYRQYLFEETYCYTKSEIAQFQHIPVNEKLSKQIENALDRQECLENLIERYLKEIVTKVAKQGGKYGFCVLCDQPAEYFCKITKASLCGIECKKKHIEIAEKQYKNYYQSVFLMKSINQATLIFAKYLLEKQSPFLFSVMVTLLQKPYLYMIVRAQQKEQLRSLLPGILYKGYESKNEQIIETLYFLIASLAKWWPSQCLSEIEFFIKEHILKVLADKKPNFKQIILVFKALDKIFQYGRTVVELFINLDCEVNHTDVIGQILFQLSKIAQDKFTNFYHFSKQQKITIKNSCMTLFMTFSRSLNEFRRQYTNVICIKDIEDQKIRKPNLEKFVQKFNQHWSEGLKTLFNLNLVGLDSNHQIVNIIMSMSGLSKKMIDTMLFDKVCEEYLDIFLSRLKENGEPLLFKLLSFYKFIPMTQTNSIGILKFVEVFSAQYNDSNLLDKVRAITSILMKAKNYEEFKNQIKDYHSSASDIDYLYLRMLIARKPQTTGTKKRQYTLCLSHSYLEPLSSQIALLQIPLSYMLQTSYDPDRVINLIKQLIPICVHSNWLSLLVKHSGIQSNSEQLLTPYNIKVIKGILQIVVMQADFIMDWLTVFNFLSNLFYLLTLNHSSNKKHTIENKTIISQQIAPLVVENSLINASIKCVRNFSRFMSGVLIIAKEQLANEQIMMLQKFFHMLDANVDKYIINFEPIYQEFRNFVVELKPTTSIQTFIYISDMLKQLLLKLLKNQDLKDEITVMHIQIFRIILQKNENNREIGDFVMNCLSTIVVYNYNLKRIAWRETIQIVDEQAQKYMQQAGVIIRKILNENMKNIENESQNLLRICFKLIKSNDVKYSIQAVHDIKMILELLTNIISAQSQKQQENEGQEKEQNKEINPSLTKDVQNLHRLLHMSIEQLIKFVDESFSEAVAQTLFLLFNTKLSFENELLLTQNQVDEFIQQIFAALQKMENQRSDTADRIMNSTLYWSAKNKNKGIIKNLQKVILSKYTTLSITALKCIKTYIQMVNLRDQKQWEDVEDTLLKIIKSTQVQRFFDISKPESIEEEIQDIINNRSATKIPSAQNVDLNVFIHECRVQMMSVELLPNHKQCLETLYKVYAQKIQFNNQILTRMGVWRKGLGKDFPPDLLLLQQTISNRIMAIYIWQNDNEEILKFCLKIMQRYIDASKKMEILDQAATEISAHCNPEHTQIYQIYADYWNKRRQPLIKLIGYILPKLIKYCQRKSDRKQLLLHFVKILPYVENKEPVLKTFKELAEKEMRD